MDSQIYAGAAVGLAVAFYVLYKKTSQLDPLFDFEQQSIEIDVKTKNRMESACRSCLIYRSDLDLRLRSI